MFSPQLDTQSLDLVGSCLSSSSSTSSSSFFSKQQFTSTEPAYQSSQHLSTSASSIPKCTSCNQTINDRYLMSIENQQWHERCLTCSICLNFLTHSCYIKEGHLYCKEDYYRLYSIKCSGCFNPIRPTELVMRLPGGPIYHLACFACIRCGRQLVKGDEFAVRQGRLVCRVDLEKDNQDRTQFWDNNSLMSRMSQNIHSDIHWTGHEKLDQPTSGSELLNDPSSPKLNWSYHLPNESPYIQQQQQQTLHLPKATPNLGKCSGIIIKRKEDKRNGPKVNRNLLNCLQKQLFKATFRETSKPCRKIREALAKKTGLSIRTVQVWFQNQRAKIKRHNRKEQQQHEEAHNSRNSNFCNFSFESSTIPDLDEIDIEAILGEIEY